MKRGLFGLVLLLAAAAAVGQDYATGPLLTQPLAGATQGTVTRVAITESLPWLDVAPDDCSGPECEIAISSPDQTGGCLQGVTGASSGQMNCSQAVPRQLGAQPANQTFLFNSSGGVPTWEPVVLCRSATPTATFTTVETDVLNCTIPANILITGARIQFFMLAALQTTGSASGTLRIYLDDTTVYDSAMTAYTNSATPYWTRLEGELIGVSDSSQLLTASLRSANVSAPTTGVGALTSNDSFNRSFKGAASEDMTVAKVLRVTITASTSSNTSFQGHFYTVHRLPF